MDHDEYLAPLAERELMSPEPEVQASVSEDIDKFFNTPLDIFPFSETTKKPKRFHVFFGEAIAERFPDDEDLRQIMARFGRRFFKAMVGYMWVKRLLLVIGLIGVSALILWGPAMMKGFGLAGAAGLGAIVGGMALLFGILIGINALIYAQYRYALENRCYSLSRLIVQRTREIQNLFLSIKALPDQEETRFPDGHQWGDRSSYLIRLLLWVGQRMEYLERYLQMQMWRTRRERYWLSWAGGIGIFLIMGAWTTWLVTRHGGGAEFRLLQGVGYVFGLVMAFCSYALFKTPVNLARDKLGVEGWIRYAALDLDNAVGDQVNRDKQRITEYRNLNKR
jgi:hypothetical protein